jgi:erythrin-vacuolar iron transport family protein
VYGLGIVLFQLLSGRPPFEGTDPFLTALERLHHSIPSLHALRPDLPPEIDQVMSHALARDPAQRYQRVSDLVAACSQVLVEQEQHSVPLKAIDPLSDATSSSVLWGEKASASTGKWQLVPPIITDRVPAIRTQKVTNGPAAFSGQTPMETEMPVQGEVVPLFDMSFMGLGHLQYTVRAHVTRPRTQQEHEARFSQPLQQARVLDQPQKVTDSIPAFPASVSGQTEGNKVTDSIPAFPTSTSDQTEGDDEASRNFLLRMVQPGLVGLIDGSVSTLAPIFATAFATQSPWTAFLVGMASATGAGISMAFAEALSDDGELTGRGNAFLRGGITGLMTFLSGAGHTLPFLVPDIHVALLFAYVVVAIELLAIAVIRYKYFNTSWWLSLLQVVGGGLLVFFTGMLFGSA